MRYSHELQKSCAICLLARVGFANHLALIVCSYPIRSGYREKSGLIKGHLPLLMERCHDPPYIFYSTDNLQTLVSLAPADNYNQMFLGMGALI